jgi:hypothetical protein
MIYLISNYSNNPLCENSENYIGYKLSRESAIDYVMTQTKSGILSSYMNNSVMNKNVNNAEYFSDGNETWTIREIEELK